MSRNIKMKRPKFEGNRKEQVAQAKERRVALLQRAKQKQAQPSVDHSPQVKAAPQSNQQVQHLERQIASLKQRLNQQTAQAARQAQKQARQLRQTNHQLRLANRQLRHQTDAELARQQAQSAAELARAQEMLVQVQKEREFLAACGWDGSETMHSLHERQAALTTWWILAYQASARRFYEQRRLVADSLARQERYRRERKKWEKKYKAAKQNSDGTRHQLKRLKQEMAWERAQYANTRGEEWLGRLINHLDPTTLSQYDRLAELNEKMLATFSETSQLTLGGQPAALKFVYGYLKIGGNQYFIHDVNHQREFPLLVSDSQQQNPKLVDGVAIKARRDLATGTYALVRVLPVINQVDHHQQKLRATVKRKRQPGQSEQGGIKLTQPAQLAWLAQQKVLVVGNKRAQAFADELKPYVEVKLMDGYEDQPRAIFTAMQAADFVFILIDSVPHAITDYTKTQPSLAPTSRKVQIFRNPRREAGVIRLSYLYATRND